MKKIKNYLLLFIAKSFLFSQKKSAKNAVQFKRWKKKKLSFEKLKIKKQEFFFFCQTASGILQKQNTLLL